MEMLRTPDDRFDGLANWPYPPRYLEDATGGRMAYVDAGPADATRVFLCLHGQPTWSYLYRRMIPVFTAAGARVIAPDLFGFGRSDKPAEEADYSFHFHRDSLLHLITALDLHRITLVVQDWGGLLGLTLPIEMADRFDRVLLMNTTLATGQSAGKGFDDWRDWSNAHPDMAVGKLMQRACPHLGPEEVAAYDAPFPDVRYKAGVRQFPRLVMTRPDMPGVDTSLRAAAFWKNTWRGESFMAIGASDPVLGLPVMRALQEMVHGCPDPLILPQAGHFVQEWGAEVATAALHRWKDI